MLRSFFVLCVLCFSCFSSLNHAEERLIHEAQYEGKHTGLTISLKKQLIDLGDNQFKITARANNFMGSITEHEIFRVDSENNLYPIEYRYEQSILGISKHRSINFDWEKKKAKTVVKKKTRTLDIKEGTLGPMSYQLKLQLDLIKEQTELDYTFVARGRIKTYKFARIETQTLNWDDSAIEQALFVKRKNQNGKRKTELWFDPKQHFVLASIRHIKGNDSHQMFLKENHYFPPLENTPFAAIKMQEDIAKK